METFKEPRLRFLGSLNVYIFGLRLHRVVGWNDNAVPTRFLALRDCSKIPAQYAYNSVIWPDLIALGTAGSIVDVLADLCIHSHPGHFYVPTGHPHH